MGNSRDDSVHTPAQSFYADDPSDYFRDRLSLLALRAGAASGLAELAAKGVAWGPIRLGGTAQGGSHEPGDRPTAAFVAIESRSLLQAVSAALVVHFLAHSDPEVEPWIGAPRLVQGGAWVARLPQLAADPPHDSVLASVAEVFLGGIRSSPSPAWLEARDTSARLLRVVARRCLADEEGPARVALGWSGLAVPASEDDDAAAHDRAWLTHLAINQLRVLWKVAAQRHLDRPHDGLDLVTAAALDVLAPTEHPPGR